MKRVTCFRNGRPSIERLLFGIAAVVVLLGIVLTLTVSLWFAALPVFVAANMGLFAVAGDCPTSMLLRRLLADERPAAARPA